MSKSFDEMTFEEILAAEKAAMEAAQESVPEENVEPEEEKEQEQEKEIEPETKEEEEPELEEKTEEEVKEEPKKEKTKSDYAKERIEKRNELKMELEAEKKRREELERRLEQMEKRQQLGDNYDPEEEIRAQNVREVEELIAENRYRRAAEEFRGIGEKFLQEVPDYADVASEYALMIAQSIKLDNPKITNAELERLTERKILNKAAEYHRKGYNPAEALYYDAKELGCTGKVFQKPIEKTERIEPKKPEPRPDLQKVAAHRARSASYTGGSTSAAYPTTEALLEMSGEEFMKNWESTPAEQKQRILRGL